MCTSLEYSSIDLLEAFLFLDPYLVQFVPGHRYAFPVRITYVTHTRFPTEKAHGNQVAHVCHALAQLGHEVTLLAPTVQNAITEDPHAYYGLPPNFLVAHPGSFDALGSVLVPGPLGFLVGMWSYRRTLKNYFRTHTADVIYARSPSILPPLLRTGIPVMLELHRLPRFFRKFFVRLCNRCFRVICLTSPMCDALVSWGADPARVSVEGDAVDSMRFENLPSKDEARRDFHIRTDRSVVGYVGRLKTLGMEKGVADLLRAVAHERGRFFAFIVGGPQSDRQEYESMATALGLTSEDVLFTGQLPASKVPISLAACDMLAMPFPDLPHYRSFMSPLKMFEYMAANRPLITSDLPSVRDVLSEETAVFCKPDDAADLARALVWIADHPAEARVIAERARTLVMERYSWKERMQRIVGDFSSAVRS